MLCQLIHAKNIVANLNDKNCIILSMHVFNVKLKLES